MPIDNDHPILDVSTQVAPIIEQTGLPSTLKGKAQRFILRWLAGSIAHPYVRQIRDNLDEIEGRSRISMILAEEVGRQAIADPEVVERAKARFLGDLHQKHVNVESVARAAQEKISAAGDSDTAAYETDTEPSADWMNSFTREAEGASSEELRQRLAGILAGEIRKPGTFSRSTIRTISELDQATLIEFQSVLSHRAGNVIIREPDWNNGPAFSRGVMLEDAGLISGSSGFTSQTMTLDPNGKGFLIGDKFGMCVEGVAGIQKQTGIWLLTRVGRELVSLLPDVDERAALRRAAALIDKNQLTRIFVGRATPTGNGQCFINYDEMPWSLPVAPPPNP